jgi:hypothetical protein
MAMLLDGLSASDTVDVIVQQEAAAGTVTVTSAASIYMEKVAAARTIFYGTATQTTNSTNLNQATEYALEWTEVVEDTGFTHDNATNPENITLVNGGDYLVTFNMPLESAATSQNVQFLIKLDGATVTGGKASQGYISGSDGHAKASTHWSGMLYNVGAGAVLTIETVIEANTGTTTVDTGKLGSVFIEEVNTANNVIMTRGTALTSGTDWNPGTAAEITWTSEDIKDATVYTHSTGASPEDITVQSIGDYLLVYNDNMTSSTANTNNKIRVLINGTAESGGESKSHHIETTSGHNDSSGSLVWLLRDLRVGDVISVDSGREARNATVDDSDDAILVLIKK